MKLNSLYKNKKIILLLFVFSLALSIISYIPTTFQKTSIIEEPIYTETDVAIEEEPISTTIGALPQNFQIRFPTSPSYFSEKQLLPKLSQKPITLHQYIAKEGTTEYKVYTTILPKKCFQWSKKIILKGALELLTQNALSPKKILTTTFKKSEKYSVLEYTLKQERGKIQTIGKLILADTSIYLIEVSIPEIELTPDCYQKIQEFFQSFELS